MPAQQEEAVEEVGAVQIPFGGEVEEAEEEGVAGAAEAGVESKMHPKLCLLSASPSPRLRRASPTEESDLRRLRYRNSIAASTESD